MNYKSLSIVFLFLAGFFSGIAFVLLKKIIKSKLLPNKKLLSNNISTISIFILIVVISIFGLKTYNDGWLMSYEKTNEELLELAMQILDYESNRGKYLEKIDDFAFASDMKGFMFYHHPNYIINGRKFKDAWGNAIIFDFKKRSIMSIPPSNWFKPKNIPSKIIKKY